MNFDMKIVNVTQTDITEYVAEDNVKKLGYSTRHIPQGSLSLCPHNVAATLAGPGYPCGVSNLLDGTGCARAALTSRTGCSNGGATRTAPRPPSRRNRAPARLFSVPKIQDSDRASRSQRKLSPTAVTLAHTYYHCDFNYSIYTATC